MRELGIIDDEARAGALADYLLTQEIPVRVVTNRDGRFAVWVQHEDRFARARAVYDEFAADPDAAKFQAATRTAREIRRRADEVEKQHRRNTRNVRERWEGPIYVRAPWTSALIVASIAVFVAEKFAGLGFPIRYWFLFSLRYEDAVGFVRDAGFTNILHGEVWRLVTPIFLHADPLHIAFNMLALATLGQRVEMVKGPWRLLAIVLITAVASNTGQYLLAGGSFGGMSGVVFALAGYLWIKGETAPEEGLGLNERAFRFMVAWFLLGILGPVAMPNERGFPFNMANGAHGVGLASGMLLGLLRL